MLRSMLQDPEFLYRIEIGTPARARRSPLNSYEIATRLSYLLVGSAPDDRLLDLAKTDALADPAARRAEATRLLADPRARDQLHRFHAMWLGYRAIPGSADLLAAFNTETTALIDKIVFDQPASYLDAVLFRARRTSTTCSPTSTGCRGLPAARAGWLTARAGAPASFRTAPCSPRSASSRTPARPSAESSCRRACSVTSSCRRRRTSTWISRRPPPPRPASSIVTPRTARSRAARAATTTSIRSAPVSSSTTSAASSGRTTTATRSARSTARARSRASARSTGRPSSGRS